MADFEHVFAELYLTSLVRHYHTNPFPSLAVETEKGEADWQQWVDARGAVSAALRSVARER